MRVLPQYVQISLGVKHLWFQMRIMSTAVASSCHRLERRIKAPWIAAIMPWLHYKIYSFKSSRKQWICNQKKPHVSMGATTISYHIHPLSITGIELWSQQWEGSALSTAQLGHPGVHQRHLIGIFYLKFYWYLELETKRKLTIGILSKYDHSNVSNYYILNWIRKWKETCQWHHRKIMTVVLYIHVSHWECM